MLRRTLTIALLVGLEVAAVLAFHHLGRRDGFAGPGTDPLAWLTAATPEEVVAGTLRLVALACAVWLLATTVAYLAARLARPGAAPHLARLVLPAVRRRIDRALAVSMLASATLGSGLAGVAAAGEPVPLPPTTITVRDGRAVEVAPVDPAPVAPPDTVPTTAGAPPPTAPAPSTHSPTIPAPTAPAPSAPPPTASPAPGPSPVPAAAAPQVHVVAPGESLWTIAALHAPGATDAELGRYWAQVVAHNRAGLRSGNPNLIHPGEVVELPPR